MSVENGNEDVSLQWRFSKVVKAKYFRLKEKTFVSYNCDVDTKIKTPLGPY